LYSAQKFFQSAMVFAQFAALSLLSVATGQASCPPADFGTVKDFDLDAFIAHRWYIQQQMETRYLPKTQNRCVYAEYKLKSKPSFWGYDVDVHNHAEDVAAPHAVHDSGSYICAKIVDKNAGKLEVAPCFLPTFAAGPYWVIAFDDTEGYALISGGAPTVSSEGGCKTGSGTNGSGLWIFTREQKRDETLVQKVRGIAQSKGFDLSVLNDVDQTECTDQPSFDALVV
jgi:lipocalin